jgi:hypothetical protein
MQRQCIGKTNKSKKVFGEKVCLYQSSEKLENDSSVKVVNIHGKGYKLEISF